MNIKKNVVGTIVFLVTSLVFTSCISTSEQIDFPAEATVVALQTEAVEFPRLCPEYAPAFISYFSPDGLWLSELCVGREYDGMILNFSNKKTHTMWTMNYRDYVTPNVQADGGMTVTHWSRDGRYVYFHTSLGGSGGYCFYTGFDTGVGLFQLNLETGEVKEVLPLIKDQIVHYQFSFSPSGEQFLYGVQNLGLAIVDIQTGGSINIIHTEDFGVTGGYLWSPNTSQLVYSTVKSGFRNNIEEYKATLRLVDTQTGKEKILLESDRNCYFAKEWSTNNILYVQYFNDYGEPAIMEYDLTSNSIINLPSPPNQ